MTCFDFLFVRKREDINVIYGYIRVSTKTQAKDGNSLETQVKVLRGAGVSEINKDAFIGKTTENQNSIG